MNFTDQDTVRHNAAMNRKVIDMIEDIDPHMRPLLKAFNQGDHFTTRFCCEGHGKNDEWGYIAFDGVLPQEVIRASMSIFGDVTENLYLKIDNCIDSTINPDGSVDFDMNKRTLFYSIHFLVEDKELLSGKIADLIKTEVGQYYADPINYQYHD